MKEIEDFLKRKLFGHQEPGSQSQNDQLWDKIDKGFSMDGPKKAPPSTVDPVSYTHLTLPTILLV